MHSENREVIPVRCASLELRFGPVRLQASLSVTELQTSCFMAAVSWHEASKRKGKNKMWFMFIIHYTFNFVTMLIFFRSHDVLNYIHKVNWVSVVQRSKNFFYLI